MNFNIEMDEFVQIIHTGEGHWVTVSTIGNVQPEVLIYDSMYTLPMLAKAQIATVSQHSSLLLRLNSWIYKCSLVHLIVAFSLLRMQQPMSWSTAWEISIRTVKDVLPLTKMSRRGENDNVSGRAHKTRC